MKVGIIAASSGGQAEVVEESIQSFFKYGNFQYHLITLKRGEICESLDGLDVLLIHYSCIAFPYRYGLPISALSSFKINQFDGLKLAFAQDEQRAGYERFDYFRSIEINHLFSVAPESLFEILYPSQNRNFAVSKLLTGYISEKHLNIASRDIPIADRPIDLSYRGRKLPDWMGLTGTLKGDIPKLLFENLGDSLENLQIDVSADEKSRIYGDKWFEFLLRSKMTIGTPSGSDYLDLYGKYSENWLRLDKNVDFSVNEPIKASYNVISPRYFDYVATGNLIALTSGNYSGIPHEEDFIKIEVDMSNIKSILEFSKSKDAQTMINKSKSRVLSRDDLKYPGYVREVEGTILSFKVNYSQSKSPNQFIVQKAEIRGGAQFLESLVLKIFEATKMLSTARKYAKCYRSITLKLGIILARENYIRIKDLPKPKLKDFWNLKLILELWRLNQVLMYSTNPPTLNNLNNGLLELYFGSTTSPRIREDSLPKYSNNKYWFINLSRFGISSRLDHLYALPKQLKYSISDLQTLIDNLIKKKCGSIEI